MALAVNFAAAALLALSILFYVFVYTIWLKRRTPQNIVIGGAAGAFPPMIGWAAVTGDVSLASLAMFAIIFMWTPPHFWALALFRAGDYARAGVPMLPVVAGVAETKRQILLYTLALLPVSLAPYALGARGRGLCGGRRCARPDLHRRRRSPSGAMQARPPPSACSATRSSTCSCCSR